MTDHDIQLLALGATAGMDLMLLVQMVFGLLDDRRDRKVAREAQAALKRSAGDRFLGSLRTYQLRQRTGVRR